MRSFGMESTGNDGDDDDDGAKLVCYFNSCRNGWRYELDCALKFSSGYMRRFHTTWALYDMCITDFEHNDNTMTWRPVKLPEPRRPKPWMIFLKEVVIIDMRHE